MSNIDDDNGFYEQFFFHFGPKFQKLCGYLERGHTAPPKSGIEIGSVSTGTNSKSRSEDPLGSQMLNKLSRTSLAAQNRANL